MTCSHPEGDFTLISVATTLGYFMFVSALCTEWFLNYPYDFLLLVWVVWGSVFFFSNTSAPLSLFNECTTADEPLRSRECTVPDVPWKAVRFSRTLQPSRDRVTMPRG